MTNLRIAIGGIAHESNAFSPTPTKYEDFFIYRDDELINHYKPIKDEIGGMIKVLNEDGLEILPTMEAVAVPSGPVLLEAYEKMRDELLDKFSKLKNVDGILLGLHGAMYVTGEEDPEGDLLRRLRKIYPNTPIICCLDLHANISKEMFELADILVGYDQNPHLDTYERGIECAKLIQKVLKEGIPKKKFIKIPLLLSPITTFTDTVPLKPGSDLAHKYEENNDVFSITVSGGFAYADHDFLGVSVCAYGNDESKLDVYVKEIAKLIWKNRAASAYKGETIKEVVAKAAFSPKTPVCIADSGDNVGGGSPGDGTFVLEEMLRAKVTNAFYILNDPEAVKYAKSIGINGDFNYMVGGKVDNLHGKPIRFIGKVINLTDGVYTISQNSHFYGAGTVMNMGDCALIRSEGIDLMLTSIATPPGEIDMIKHIGVNPYDYRMINVKGAVAFRGNYKQLNGEILEAASDGVVTCDFDKIPFKNNHSNLYPFNLDIEFNI